MTPGTTRQILADLQRQRDHVSQVRVTRSDDAGMVQVTIAPSPQGRAAALKLLYTFIGIFGTLVFLSLVFRFPAGLVLFAWLLICSVVMALVSYDHAGRAYVFRSGREGIVVGSSGPLGARNWECRRADLRDVRLVARRSPLSKRLGVEFRPQWIYFDLIPGWRNRVAIALDLSRDEFVQLADAVREGLGMLKQPWS